MRFGSLGRVRALITAVLALAVGALCVPSLALAAAPTNVSPPTITGEMVDTQTVTAHAGTWDTGGAPGTAVFQWFRCNASGGACVELRPFGLDVNLGTTPDQSRHTLTEADFRNRLKVQVTFVSAGGASVPVFSALTDVIGADIPVIVGTARDGELLHVDGAATTAEAQPAAYGYRWWRCVPGTGSCQILQVNNPVGINNSVRHGPSYYRLTENEVGYTIIAVRYSTALNSEPSLIGADVGPSSDQTAVVQALAPENQVRPTVVGVAQEGETLRTTDGVWTGSHPQLSYGWQRCTTPTNCLTILSENENTYTLTSEDVTKRIVSVVTGTNPAGSQQAESDPTDEVQSRGGNSNSCVSPAAKTVFDGYAGSTYAKLVTDRPTTDTAAVCYRLDQDEFRPGGRLDVAADAGVPSPEPDTSYNACSTASGNTIPGQHPLFTNTTLGFTQMVDAYSNSSGDAWLCLRADPVVGSRVKFSQPSGSRVPTNSLDSPSLPAPPPTPGPPGLPSSSCQAGSGNVRAINANIADVQTWLYGRQASSTSVELCVRAQTPTNGPTKSAGGRLTVDATGVPGVSVVGPTVSTDTTPCSLEIEHFSSQGVDVTISSSPAGTNPATVCVQSTSLPQPVAVTAGVTGGAGTPDVTWDADPGTPDPDGGSLSLF
jgi:hypothetical protein